MALASIVDLMVDSDDGMAHPDLLDELVARVLTLYRVTCVEDGET